jgi:AAA15 family ATPase/GTPase
MIDKLNIKNFKSIKDLEIPCKKLNVFIGEPNSGKSNIIEALSFRSQNALFDNHLNPDLFRYKTISDLFFDFNINDPIEINTGDIVTQISYDLRKDGSPGNKFIFLPDTKIDIEKASTIEHDGKVNLGSHNLHTNVHFYEFKRLNKFNPGYLPHLSVPFGDNLPGLLLSNKELKKWVSDFLLSKGLRLTLKPSENDIAASKLVDNEIYSYPYFALSETLQRIIFYTVAIQSNKENILLLDEPDSNTFPIYTKLLAEKIALDETNQFFVATHNPYLLINLVEKSKFEDLNVCITEMVDYETRVNVLDEDQISHVLNFDSYVFFNFNKVLGR